MTHPTGSVSARDFRALHDRLTEARTDLRSAAVEVDVAVQQVAEALLAQDISPASNPRWVAFRLVADAALAAHAAADNALRALDATRRLLIEE